jgi:hypothetical protein
LGAGRQDTPERQNVTIAARGCQGPSVRARAPQGDPGRGASP